MSVEKIVQQTRSWKNSLSNLFIISPTPHWNRNLLNQLWENWVVEQIIAIPRGGNEPMTSDAGAQILQGSVQSNPYINSSKAEPWAPIFHGKNYGGQTWPQNWNFLLGNFCLINSPVPTKAKLHKREYLIPEATCSLCHQQDETVTDLFAECNTTKTIWKMFPHFLWKTLDT